MKLKRMFMGLIMALIYLLTICINVSAYGEISSKEADLTISNLKELVAFRDSVNNGNTYKGKTVKLLKDIDMSSIDNWEPIGTGGNPFLGVFNGRNKTIMNLKNYASAAGFFGVIGIKKEYVGATIKNLKIKNTSLRGGIIGIVAGYAAYSNIYNCSVQGSGYLSNTIGGIIGYGEYSNIDSCYSSVDTSQGSTVGGIVGESNSCTITNSVVENISTNGTQCAGGIIGKSSKTNVYNCKVRTAKFFYGVSAGGLIGDSTYNTIINSSFSGRIRGLSNVGGLIGNCLESTVVNCFSSGNVLGKEAVGGLIGYMRYDSKIINSFTLCDVSKIDFYVDNIDSLKYFGGFAGVSGNCTIVNCYSFGENYGVNCKGGFIGGSAFTNYYINNYYNSQSINTAFGYTEENIGVPLGKSLTSMKDQSFAFELNGPIPENIAKMLKENNITVYKYNWKYGENNNLPFIDSNLPY